MGLAHQTAQKGAASPTKSRLLQAEANAGGSEVQSQDTQKSNVVSLFAARQKADEEASTGTSESAEPTESFEQVMARNDKNKERLAKERASANKSVLRSYRIKH
jgi:hypothetical protein